MAIFDKQSKDEAEVVVTPETEVKATSKQPSVSRKQILALPRLSEKANSLASLNKYVFKVTGKANKIEMRKAIEKFYDIKIADINVINVKGKFRRYGQSFGKMSNFKKAVVTLTPDSKKPQVAEVA